MIPPTTAGLLVGGAVAASESNHGYYYGRGYYPGYGRGYYRPYRGW